MPCNSPETDPCGNYTPAGSKRDIVKTILQTVLTLLVGLLVTIGNDIKNSNTRIEGTLKDYGVRITKIESWMGEGRRYTKEDAGQDQGVVLGLLESQGKTLDDHEDRLRIIERRNP